MDADSSIEFCSRGTIGLRLSGPCGQARISHYTFGNLPVAGQLGQLPPGHSRSRNRRRESYWECPGQLDGSRTSAAIQSVFFLSSAIPDLDHSIPFSQAAMCQLLWSFSAAPTLAEDLRGFPLCLSTSPPSSPGARRRNLHCRCLRSGCGALQRLTRRLCWMQSRFLSSTKACSTRYGACEMLLTRCSKSCHPPRPPIERSDRQLSLRRHRAILCSP